jgi:tetratricopeptide (TPR) repeat protein
MLRPLLPDRLAGARLEASLGRLRESGFAIELSAARTYAFNHVLTQQVAYETLPYAERRRLHLRIGSQIEEAQDGRLDAACELLLYHFEAGNDYRKAARYALMSGDRAAAVFANQEALQYYERSVRAVDHIGVAALDARSTLSERIGDCLETAGRHTEALSRYDEALDLWRQRGRRSRILPSSPDEAAREAAICRKLAVSSERGLNYDGSLYWLNEALRALPRRRSRLAAQIYAAESVAHFRRGQYDEGVRWGARAVALARRTGDPRQIGYARNMLANSYMERGELHKAAVHLHGAVRLYGEAHDFPGQASANNNLGKCYHLQGVYDAALYHYDVALRADERAGDTVDAVIVHHNIGEALLALGRIDEAEEHFREVIRAMERDPDLTDAGGLAELNLCRCRMSVGDLEGAEAHPKNIRLLRRIGAYGLLAEAFLQRTHLLIARQDPAAAARDARRALAQVRKLGNRLLEGRGQRLNGTALSALGRDRRAERALRTAIALAKEIGAEHEEALARAALGAHLLKSGARPREARTQITRAISVLARMGAAPDVAMAQQLLRRLRK